MRLWLSRNSEVPLREQLSAQLILGIISHDLKPRQKLPSTRELAQRLRIHANTVSAAYRDLARRGWVDHRRGSGVFVRALSIDSLKDGELDLGQLISTFVQLARARGHSLAEIKHALGSWLDSKTADRFLVIDPDQELRKILAAEVHAATGFQVTDASPEECTDPALISGAAPVRLYGRADNLESVFPPGTSCFSLQFRSVPAALQLERRPAADELVTVVSRCEVFLAWSKTVLVAAGIEPDALSFRDARLKEWRKGLSGSSLVISDALCAGQIPRGCNVRIFRIIADSSLEELVSYKEFLSRSKESL